MKKVFVCMPCYISNNNRFKKELTATIKSLEGCPNIFKKINKIFSKKNSYFYMTKRQTKNYSKISR